MDENTGDSDLLALIGFPIAGVIVLIALCYCMYRCCCCCCRRDKHVVVVNTTNMLQPARENPSVVVVNNVPPPRTEFDNPGYGMANAPLLSHEMAPTSDWSPEKY